MRDLKEMFAARLVPLAKMLIKAEAEAHGASESEIIEDWAFKYARSEKARLLLLQHSQTDTLTAAVASVIRENVKEIPHDASKPPGKPSVTYKLPTKHRKKVA